MEQPNKGRNGPKSKETLKQIYQALGLLVLFTVQVVMLNVEELKPYFLKYVADFLQMLIFILCAWLIFLLVLFINQKRAENEKKPNQ